MLESTAGVFALAVISCAVGMLIERRRTRAANSRRRIKAYFMAHAPKEPPAWFEPVMYPRPQQVTWPSDLSKDEREAVNCFVEGLCDVDEIEIERIRVVAQQKVDADKALSAWRKTRMRELEMQWPAAWAELQIDELMGDRHV